MELTVPRRTPPIAEVLCDARGVRSDATLALRLIRAIEDAARSDPGARLAASCAPSVAVAAAPLAEQLAGKIGARFVVEPAAQLPRERFEVRSL